MLPRVEPKAASIAADVRGTAYVPSPRKNVVVLFGNAGTHPLRLAVTVLHSAVNCALVYSPRIPALSNSTRVFVPPAIVVVPTVRPPEGGAANVPSARRKFVVPPPEAGTQPISVDVKILHSVVN